MTRLRVKRIMDVALASAGLILAAPLMLGAAIIVRMVLGSPVLFRQERPGLHGRPFVVYKFRTMTNARDGRGDLLPDAERLTRIGRAMRRWSLDELPQLWNVLKGDMSIVGPRPLLTEYLALYTPEQNRRHDVPPGLVGWATVNGRNAITWERKFALDLWYVDHWSVTLDLKILIMAVRVVFSGAGVSREGSATCEKFKGCAAADKDR